VRVLLPAAAFEAWHGLLTAPAFYGPLVYGTAINVACAAVLVAAARRIFLARDIV
jgi:hypothetical protein